MNQRNNEIMKQVQDQIYATSDPYKESYKSMSIGSLRAIADHALSILNSLDNPRVSENLTAPHLQGIIAVAEDHMRSIHDFVMFVDDSSDTSESSSKPGLWDNIRKKKEREGKKYKPAKRGDPDRPDPKMWKKLTKDSKDSKKK
jgi:hypothetical protein